MKNNIVEIEEKIKNEKAVAMLAPSFIVEFGYPEVVFALKKLGFDKVVELTFGAKIVNSEYHKILKEKKLWISTVCPGVSEFIKNNYPQYNDSLIQIDSPMVAMAKVCKKQFPKHKIIFISPCHFKKKEAELSSNIDYVLDFMQVKNLFERNNIDLKKMRPGRCQIFDSLYNDYTKIYPLAGGLYKTAKFRGIVNEDEVITIDGIMDVKKVLDNGIPKNIRFMDVNFCKHGCIGGPCISKEISIQKRKARLKKYLNYSKKASIGKGNFGSLDYVKDISFSK